MLRRNLLIGGLSAIFIGCRAHSQQAEQRDNPGMDDFQQQMAAQAREATREAQEYFPYPLTIVPGAEALAVFDRLRRGGATPVILGGDEAFARMAEVWHPDESLDMWPSVEESLAAAAQLEHPQSLKTWEQDMTAAFAERMGSPADIIARIPDDRLPPIEENGRLLTPDEIRTKLTEQQEAAFRQLEDYEESEPEIGEWPSGSHPESSILAVTDILTGAHLDPVYIASIPTRDWTEIPAYLKWGGWNACPPPQHHVAAFRSWRERYGAELVSIAGDMAELRIARRPSSREDAMALAREVYDYCPDAVDQGAGALAPLAASLMASQIWTFWWD